ncbi:MAG: hypothetical protein PHR06_13745 [Candidatus Cloacimonetes bacterium]|nr:hypothetical protein [Candidatus Cloacimonadota bacterium]
MNTLLLKNLGVNKRIVDALDKSYAGHSQCLEILQDNTDLKLQILRNDDSLTQPWIIKLERFFDTATIEQISKKGINRSKIKYNCDDKVELLPNTGCRTANVIINGLELRVILQI